MDTETVAGLFTSMPSVDALVEASSDSKSLLLTRFEKLLVLQQLVKGHFGEDLEVHERQEVGLQVLVL